jgi:AraC-like DNA-binding protein
MFDVVDNLARMARGPRDYRLRPVICRARGFWELQWIFQGGAHPHTATGREYWAKTPGLYLHHPDSTHGWTADEGAEASEVFVLHFRTIPAELAMRMTLTKPLIIELGASEFRRQKARLDELWRMKETADVRLGLKLGQMLIEVALQVLGRPVLADKGDPQETRVEQALHWFAENVGENPTADAVARAVGVSPPHLRRLFAAAGRAAPREELARIKMEAAQRCLLDGWRLERIAQYLGFSEASAFSRAFTGVCGVAPTEWLARAGQKPENHADGGAPGRRF